MTISVTKAGLEFAGRLAAKAWLTLALSAAANTSVAALEQDAGWWVVVGAFPQDPPTRQEGDLRRMGAAARRCGLRTLNDDSAKFVGFRPGLNVFVIGPLASSAEAKMIQQSAQRCFPGSYVKRSRYMGE